MVWKVWSWGPGSNSVVYLHKSALVGGCREGTVVLTYFFLQGQISQWPCSCLTLLISSSGVPWNGLDFVCQDSPLSCAFWTPQSEGNIIHELILGGALGGSAFPWKRSFFSGLSFKLLFQYWWWPCQPLLPLALDPFVAPALGDVGWQPEMRAGWGVCDHDTEFSL